jgi:hypothetical protein
MVGHVVRDIVSIDSGVRVKGVPRDAGSPSRFISARSHGAVEKERRRVGGDTLDAASHAGLAQGRTSDAKPALILRGGGQGNVRGGSLRPLSRDRRSVSLLGDFCAWGWASADPPWAYSAAALGALTPAWNEGWGSVFPDQALRGTLCSAPFRRPAELVGFGNRGMRDCATPDSLCQSACATTQS